jgi:heme A synthase
VLILAVVWSAPLRSSVSSRLAALLGGCYLLQLGVGLLNVWFLAPVSLQIIHLLLSDVLWIALVLFAASVLAPGDLAGRVPAAIAENGALRRRASAP